MNATTKYLGFTIISVDKEGKHYVFPRYARKPKYVAAALQAAIKMIDMDKRIELIKQTDTDDGKVRYDILVDGVWSSSWDRKTDAETCVENMIKKAACVSK